jgi:hypothetical protein
LYITRLVRRAGAAKAVVARKRKSLRRRVGRCIVAVWWVAEWCWSGLGDGCDFSFLLGIWL